VLIIKEIKRYDITNIKNKNCTYNLIHGKRSNGKSYQVKDMVLDNYLKNGKRFIYLRRTANEIKRDLVTTYFNDFDIKKLTNGKYNCITAYANKFYLANIDDNFKIRRGDYIGYIWTLIHEENYKSGSYLDVDNIIFEEFITKRLYLTNEAQKLESVYSTVDRGRKEVKVWLIGNTMTQYNPYLDGWKIRKDFLSLKQGDIKTKNIYVGKDIFGRPQYKSIAMEYCSSDAGAFQGAISSNMIDSGDYEVDIQPLLPYNYKDCKLIFRFVFAFKNERFMCEYLNYDNDYFFFIYPKYSEVKDNTIVIGDIINPSIYYQGNIYNFESKNKRVNEILASFRESNTFYCSHLCGTTFKQLINFTIKP